MNNINIIFNGVTRSVEPRHHSYDNLVFLLKESDPTVNASALYTITYDRGPAGRREGSVAKGGSVLLVEGMIVNIGRTDNA